MPVFDSFDSDAPSLENRVAGPAVIGWLLGGLAIAGFGMWALSVPLAGGAIANGIVSPEGSHKTVQHLEGGIVARLHVRDGDVVATGQPLVEIESLQARATFDSLQSQQRAFSLTKLRLEAEQSLAPDIALPDDVPIDDAVSHRLFEGQRELLRVRRDSHIARKQVQDQRIAQFNEEISGYQAQIDGVAEQLDLIADELKSKRWLFKQGLVTKPAMRQLERIAADLNGRRGEYKAAIARAKEQITEARLQIHRLDAERLDAVTTELEKVRVDLLATQEKLRTSADILSRTVVTAPVAGIIANLKYKAERGVVQPGSPILDIVPSDDRLLIDARISPTDIDSVHPGLTAQVQLTAYSMQTTSRVIGTVRTVSADRLVDEATRVPYFLARVEVDRDSLANAGRDIKLLPGMPADVLIVTGERTLAQYLLQPFQQALWRTFREG